MRSPGGLHVTSLPDEAAAHADTIFLGPGEQTFPQFLADLRAGQARPRYVSSQGRTLEGLAPGGQVQLAYRTGDFDLGLSVDALFAQASHDGSVSVDGATVTTSTTASTLQVLAGPWVRYRFTDWLGVDLTAGAGVARTTEQIDSGTTTNASGTTSPLALGGMAGLDFNFGLVRAFAGARYLTASASGDLSGNAGGLAVLGGVGVDLGL